MAVTNLADLQNRGVNGVAFDLNVLSLELEAYGESEAAAWLRQISSDVHAKVSESAQTKMVSLGCTTDKAICLAAIEVLEGAPRELRRKKRAYKN